MALLARLVIPDRQHVGVLMAVLLGIGGALIGGTIASEIGEGDIFELNFIGTIFGLIAAVLLIAVAEGLGFGHGQTRRH